jgi:hypothetical protein
MRHEYVRDVAFQAEKRSVYWTRVRGPHATQQPAHHFLIYILRQNACVQLMHKLASKSIQLAIAFVDSKIFAQT